MWHGTEAGCVEDGDDDVEPWSELSKKERKKCGEKIEAIAAVEQGTFYGGKVICAKRGGLPFKDIVRAKHNPESDEVQCPKGFEPCSFETNSEDTVCYDPNDKEYICPINSFEFIQDSSVDIYKQMGYKVEQLSETSFLAASSQGLEGFVMKFFLGQDACLMGDSYKYDDDDVFYPLEKDRLQKCQVDTGTGEYYDTRY